MNKPYVSVAPLPPLVRQFCPWVCSAMKMHYINLRTKNQYTLRHYLTIVSWILAEFPFSLFNLFFKSSISCLFCFRSLSALQWLSTNAYLINRMTHGKHSNITSLSNTQLQWFSPANAPQAIWQLLSEQNIYPEDPIIKHSSYWCVQADEVVIWSTHCMQVGLWTT